MVKLKEHNCDWCSKSYASVESLQAHFVGGKHNGKISGDKLKYLTNDNDTLNKVANAHGFDVDALLSVNKAMYPGITRNARLQPATFLYVKQLGTASPTKHKHRKTSTAQMWNAEKLIKQRQGSKGIDEYLVKWEDCPVSEATWEPVSNLNDNLIQKYDEKKAAEAARKKELATERKRKREAEETEALAVKKGQVEAAAARARKKSKATAAAQPAAKRTGGGDKGSVAKRDTLRTKVAVRLIPTDPAGRVRLFASNQLAMSFLGISGESRFNRLAAAGEDYGGWIIDRSANGAASCAIDNGDNVETAAQKKPHGKGAVSKLQQPAPSQKRSRTSKAVDETRAESCVSEATANLDGLGMADLKAMLKDEISKRRIAEAELTKMTTKLDSMASVLAMLSKAVGLAKDEVAA